MTTATTILSGPATKPNNVVKQLCCRKRRRTAGPVDIIIASAKIRKIDLWQFAVPANLLDKNLLTAGFSAKL